MLGSSIEGGGCDLLMLFLSPVGGGGGDLDGGEEADKRSDGGGGGLGGGGLVGGGGGGLTGGRLTDILVQRASSGVDREFKASGLTCFKSSRGILHVVKPVILLM